MATTEAVVVVGGGRPVAERYGGTDPRSGATAPVGPETTLRSWSLAKSMLHAVVGMLVGKGRLGSRCPRSGRRLGRQRRPERGHHPRPVLEMRDGLAFVEDYVADGVSDVREMLWGTGRHDVAAFAADRPFIAAPGSLFQYS